MCPAPSPAFTTAVVCCLLLLLVDTGAVVAADAGSRRSHRGERPHPHHRPPTGTTSGPDAETFSSDLEQVVHCDVCTKTIQVLLNETLQDHRDCHQGRGLKHPGKCSNNEVDHIYVEVKIIEICEKMAERFVVVDVNDDIKLRGREKFLEEKEFIEKKRRWALSEEEKSRYPLPGVINEDLTADIQSTCERVIHEAHGVDALASEIMQNLEFDDPVQLPTVATVMKEQHCKHFCGEELMDREHRGKGPKMVMEEEVEVDLEIEL